LDAQDVLQAIAQVLEMPEQSERWQDAEGLALAPESEGGSRYRAECSASLLSPHVAITAAHCLRSKRNQIERNHVLRRHLFAWSGTTLQRVGYEDFRLSGRIIATQGDLVAIEIAPSLSNGTPFAPIRAIGADADSYLAGTAFVALGYPSFAYGEPHVSPACHIHDFQGSWSAVSPGDYGSKDCLLRGGMSGGPQLLQQSGAQIGINSLSGGTGQETWTSSPRMPPLNP
jgi:V8-like Glu-specific endopeptidase